MFRTAALFLSATIFLTQAPAFAQGVNPTAATKAAEMPADAGVTPEVIDMMADAVIAKLRAKPEILLDIILSYEEKNRSGMAMIRADDPVTGAPDGDVTIVEFFDPTCIPCRTTGSAVDAAAAADRKLKVVHKDFPTSEAGIEISVNALGGKSYAESRHAILAGRTPAVVTTGRDKALAILAQNRAAAERAHVTVLPTLFLVGNSRVERIEGPVTAETIAAKVATLRAARK